MSGVESCLVGSGPLLWVHTVVVQGGARASQSSLSFTCMFLFSNAHPGLKWVFLVPFSGMPSPASATWLCSLACLLPELLSEKLQLFYQLELQEKLSQDSLAEQASPFPHTGAQHSWSSVRGLIKLQLSPTSHAGITWWMSRSLFSVFSSAGQKQSENTVNLYLTLAQRSSYDFREILVPLKARWCRFDCWEERCWTTA